MQIKKVLFASLIIISLIFVSACISSDEEEEVNTTTPPPESYYLYVTIDGASTEEVGLSEIKSLEFQNITATMVKKTGAEIETSWGGTSFYGLMDHLGISNISEVTLVALDGYQKTIDYTQIAAAILAWEDETGEEISEEDGGPIRFVAPGLPSNTWMQNLLEVQVTTQ